MGAPRHPYTEVHYCHASPPQAPSVARDAFVALLAALSGTAVALPGNNAVNSGDIKNGQVKGKDIGKNAVTGKKVKNSSLLGGDVKNESLTSGDVKDESLTGSDINESTLGKVPSAGTADLANSVAASEAYHEIGSFGAGCTNAVVSGQPDVFEWAAFYKDLEGVVHLRGVIECDPTSVIDEPSSRDSRRRSRRP